MEIKVDYCVLNSGSVKKNATVKLQSSLSKSRKINHPDLIAYPPFINSHDHFISDWYPKAGFGHRYDNASQWVKEMVKSKSVEERKKIWVNDGNFDLTDPDANLIIQLGLYKNICSGCAVVQDHVPNQKADYYQDNPITVLQNYMQCHSISMGNWWGGSEAKSEWEKTKGEIPFIIHLAEGKDDSARKSFSILREQGLLQSNTMLIHGIALTKEEIKTCSETGASICWCPDSNFYLIGETLDVEACLEYGTNIVLGTDSTMTGSLNILTEMNIAARTFPEIDPKELFKMVTVNAKRALMLDDHFGKLTEENPDLLIMKKRSEDPFANLLESDINDIQFFVYQGIPIYGNKDFLSNFDINPENYYFFDKDRFVIGHPEKVLKRINQKLGYNKDFPFLPF